MFQKNLSFLNTSQARSVNKENNPHSRSINQKKTQAINKQLNVSYLRKSPTKPNPS